MEIQLAEKLGCQQDSDQGSYPEAGAGGPGALRYPGRGAEVAQRYLRKSLRDVLEVRCSLEELAIELARQGGCPEDEMAELERMQGNFKKRH